MSRTNAVTCTAGRRPRVGLVAVDDGLYTHRWILPLLEDADLEVVCAACLSPFRALDFNPRGARGLRQVSLARLRYYGLAATWKFACKSACGRVRDLLFVIGLGRQPCSVASAVRAQGIEVFSPPQHNVNHPDFCARLASFHPDLLVCAFSQRTKPAFLETARLGCLNVHFSLLPEHRGREPLFRAMLSGTGAGVSVHWMTAEIDTGAVVCQQPLDAGRYKTLHHLILDACDLAGRVVPQAVHEAIRWQGDKSGPPNVSSLAGWPSPEEIILFKQRGLGFV